MMAVLPYGGSLEFYARFYHREELRSGDVAISKTK
jgi:hypothetical protein